MTDIRLVQKIDQFAVTIDWLQTTGGLLDETQELQTAAIVALGTDHLANQDDELPDIGNDDRRGWWGDDGAEQIWGGWPIGTRLWLLARAKITDADSRQGSTVARVETYIREALHPFLAKGLASKMAVSATRSGVERIEATATLYRGPIRAVSLQYQILWDGIQN